MLCHLGSYFHHDRLHGPLNCVDKLLRIGKYKNVPVQEHLGGERNPIDFATLTLPYNLLLQYSLHLFRRKNRPNCSDSSVFLRKEVIYNRTRWISRRLHACRNIKHQRVRRRRCPRHSDSIVRSAVLVRCLECFVPQHVRQRRAKARRRDAKLALLADCLHLPHDGGFGGNFHWRLDADLRDHSRSSWVLNCLHPALNLLSRCLQLRAQTPQRISAGPCRGEKTSQETKIEKGW